MAGVYRFLCYRAMMSRRRSRFNWQKYQALARISEMLRRFGFISSSFSAGSAPRRRSNLALQRPTGLMLRSFADPLRSYADRQELVVVMSMSYGWCNYSAWPEPMWPSQPTHATAALTLPLPCLVSVPSQVLCSLK